MSAKELVIHLTGRPPIKIVDVEWPVIARAVWHDGETQAMSKERAYVRVRRHDDGRSIVYGLRSAGSIEHKEGYLVASGNIEELTASIHKTCALVGIEPQTVCDDLPPEEI